MSISFQRSPVKLPTLTTKHFKTPANSSKNITFSGKTTKYELFISPEHYTNPFERGADKIVATDEFKKQHSTYKHYLTKSREAKILNTAIVAGAGAAGAAAGIDGNAVHAILGAFVGGAASGPYSGDITASILSKLKEPPSKVKEAAVLREQAASLNNGIYMHRLKHSLPEFAKPQPSWWKFQEPNIWDCADNNGNYGKGGFGEHLYYGPAIVMTTAMISRYPVQQDALKEILPTLQRSSRLKERVIPGFRKAAETAEANDGFCDGCYSNNPIVKNAVDNMSDMCKVENILLESNVNAAEERKKYYKHLTKTLAKVVDYLEDN